MGFLLLWSSAAVAELLKGLMFYIQICSSAWLGYNEWMLELPSPQHKTGCPFLSGINKLFYPENHFSSQTILYKPMVLWENPTWTNNHAMYKK